MPSLIVLLLDTRHLLFFGFGVISGCRPERPSGCYGKSEEEPGPDGNLVNGS